MTDGILVVTNSVITCLPFIKLNCMYSALTVLFSAKIRGSVVCTFRFSFQPHLLWYVDPMTVRIFQNAMSREYLDSSISFGSSGSRPLYAVKQAIVT